MESCRNLYYFLKNSSAILIAVLAILSSFSSISYANDSCDTNNLYGVVWSVDGCSCSGDTISKTKVGAYAEDSIGYSHGWIDVRDLICNPKTGQWKAKDKPKFATCSGCKAGYGLFGTCGSATQKLHSSRPTIGLCTCGSPSSVKKIGQAWQWSCGDASQTSSVNCIAPVKSRKQSGE